MQRWPAKPTIGHKRRRAWASCLEFVMFLICHAQRSAKAKRAQQRPMKHCVMRSMRPERRWKAGTWRSTR